MARMIAALAISVLSFWTPALGANLPALSIAEQAGMDRVLLQYMAAHDIGCLAKTSDFDCYVALQGRVPSQAELDSMGMATGKLNPWNVAEIADPKKNVIGSGHNVLRLIIGGFSMTGTDTAHASVQSGCGKLCGDISTATLKKIKGNWTVASFKVDMMQ